MTRRVVEEHLAAFNAHDTDRLLATLHPDVVWRTGSDVFTGTGTLRRDVFDDGLWQLAPSLTTQTLLVDGPAAAAILTERLTVDGVEQSFDIAAFFTVDAGVIRSVTVFREGSADVVR